MKKSIKVKPALEKRLEEVYDVSQQFVSYALSFQRHGEKAEAIRRAALQLGGAYIQEGFVPTCSIERTKEGFRQIQEYSPDYSCSQSSLWGAGITAELQKRP